jgi:PAS domain S-box-containing protein
MHLLAPLVRLRDAIVALRAKPAGYTPLPVARATKSASSPGVQCADAGTAGGRCAPAESGGIAPNAILVVGGSGRIETMNREAERCFVYARAKCWGGLDHAGAAAPHELFDGMQQRFFSRGPGAAGAIGREQVLYGLRRDGSEFPLEINLSAVRTDQGVKVLAVISDITERHRLRRKWSARRGTRARTRPRQGGQPRQERFRGQYEP